jgi:exosortase
MRSSRYIQFVAFSVLLPAVFHDPLQRLIAFAYESHLFFYIVLIPFVSLYFFYVRKGKNFSNVTYCLPAGGLIVLTGFTLYFVEKKWGPLLGPTDGVSVMTAAFLLTWVGGFIGLFGLPAGRRALFPIGFLLCMIPIPVGLLDQIIVFLQKGSGEPDVIFRLSGLPIERDGFVFALSNLEIEVAKSCSGIRSCLYLLLTGLVMGQFFFKTTSRKILLVLAVVPIAIFKNWLRIVNLSLLGNYVHASILSSNLHRQGGIPFMILAVILLSIVILGLRKSEKHAVSGQSSDATNPSLTKGGDARPIGI